MQIGWNNQVGEIAGRLASQLAAGYGVCLRLDLQLQM